MDSYIIQNWLNIVRDIFIDNIDLDNYDIFLFGSFARGDFRQDSDIDIGIRGKECLNTDIIHKIRDQLEDSIVPNKIDIVDFSSINNDKFKKTAMKDVIIWNKARNCH